MEIVFQNVITTSIEKLNTNVSNKLNRLSKKHSYIKKAEVFFKSETNNHGNRKVCEIKLFVSDFSFFVKCSEADFTTAIKNAIHILEHKLKNTDYFKVA